MAVVTIGDDEPDDGSAAGERGAEPPAGGPSVIIGDAFVPGGAASTRTEVRELCAVTREVRVIAGTKANLVTGQQEDFAAQAVCAGRYRASRTSAVLIRDFHLLDGVLDVIIEQVQEGSVQVGVDVGVLVVVVRAVPSSHGVDVFAQQPSAVAARIVHTGRKSLMHHKVILIHPRFLLYEQLCLFLNLPILFLKTEALLFL